MLCRAVPCCIVLCSARKAKADDLQAKLQKLQESGSKVELRAMYENAVCWAAVKLQQEQADKIRVVLEVRRCWSDCCSFAGLQRPACWWLFPSCDIQRCLAPVTNTSNLGQCVCTALHAIASAASRCVRPNLHIRHLPSVPRAPPRARPRLLRRTCVTYLPHMYCCTADQGPNPEGQH